MSRNPKALGAYSFVLHERGAHGHHWSGTGCLSIKSFTGCEAFYDVGRGFCKVDDSSYLILNTDQDYSISVEDASPGLGILWRRAGIRPSRWKTSREGHVLLRIICFDLSNRSSGKRPTSF